MIKAIFPVTRHSPSVSIRLWNTGSTTKRRAAFSRNFGTLKSDFPATRRSPCIRICLWNIGCITEGFYVVPRLIDILCLERVDDLSFFVYLSPFFLLIEFNCSFSIFYKILPDYVYYYYISTRIWYAVGTSFIRARCTFSILTPLFCVSSTVSLSYFILAVPRRECLGKHSCMSSQFPIAILNGTSSFLSLVQENINMPSGHYYRLCSWSGRWKPFN